MANRLLREDLPYSTSTILNVKAGPMEKRRYSRYTVQYAGSFVGDGINAAGVLVNLSATGCRARSESRIRNGILLHMFINVPRYSDPLHARFAAVRWSDGKDFGVEFAGMSLDDLQRLYELICAIEANKSSASLPLNGEASEN